MIKFATETSKGGLLIGLGLSEGNFRMLRKDKPIIVNLKDLGVETDKDIEIMIFWGKTEQAMAHKLKQFIGEETMIRYERTVNLGKIDN